MSKIFFNQTISLKKGVVWESKFGDMEIANEIISLTGVTTKMVKAQLYTIDKKIKLYEEIQKDEYVVGVFFNNTFGYEMIHGYESFSNQINSAYNNICSKFGIYGVGTLIKCHSYKFRKNPTFYRLEVDGWKKEDAE